MLIIGLTGGIGSGKSTVADLFTQLGVPVIDTDEISRQLVEPGQPALNEIVSTFKDVLTANGELDRAKLRQIIFTQPNKRRQLEEILHPMIQSEVKVRLSSLNHPYAIVVIPLLTEQGKWSFIDRVIVVDCSEQLQLQRAMQRDEQGESQIKDIIQVQASRQQRLEIADDVITNESDFAQLKTSIEHLNENYLQLADN